MAKRLSSGVIKRLITLTQMTRRVHAEIAAAKPAPSKADRQTTQPAMATIACKNYVRQQIFFGLFYMLWLQQTGAKRQVGPS
ncbi:hypothetical protein [Rhizobium sp. PDO1-076]|uniref:hypothetical protein n=1 Tax=Rhizobium sp. PDO1-076 TaxID=1125979 RepID=UPI00178C367D|nr:hypothetical protein [Rhizobium sp. PDO1-076]